MITDFETNTIYFSELLKAGEKYAKVFCEISKILNAIGVEYDLLPKTKDI